MLMCNYKYKDGDEVITSVTRMFYYIDMSQPAKVDSVERCWEGSDERIKEVPDH
jgi:hypothetical protein